jgi:cytidylate kinase
MNTIIAIDGLAASGKGTIAKRIAEHFELPYLDTGKLYRVVGSYMLEKQLSLTDSEDISEMVQFARRIDLKTLGSPKLRSDEVGNAASIVSVLPEIRTALLGFQRDFAHQPKGAVLDGRDIGTVICPEASHKFFITADVGIRAQRRTNELQAYGKSATYARVLRDLEERDARDKTREIAPLVPPTDAIVVDTTKLDIDAAVAKVTSYIR